MSPTSRWEIFPPSRRGKTNSFRLHTTGVRYGDKIRLRTVGTFGVRHPGEPVFGSEETQPFLGFLTGGINHPNFYYIAAPPVDPHLPSYVTPPIEANGKVIPTDSPRDFLITPEGVTLCVPVDSNLLGMLNPDPRVRTRDADNDFRIEVIPLEGARVGITATLNFTNVIVGDTVKLTLSLTNSGNVPAVGIAMYIDEGLRRQGYSEMEFDTNLLQIASGPTPRNISSIPPGGSATIEYTFRAIAPGTNNFYARVGQTVCGDQFWQALSRFFGPLVISPIIDATPRQPTAAVYSEDSLHAGRQDTEAPLLFSVDEAALGAATEFPGRGLIADGITPLLLRLEIAPDKLDRYVGEAIFRVEARLISGELDGVAIGDRIETLTDGVWSTGGELKLSQEKPVGHVALKAFLPDELRISESAYGIVVRVDLRDQTDLIVGRLHISIRRPPIALIHGYNTNGDWGGEFIKELATTRSAPFVRIARYGQVEIDSPTTGHQAAINTLWPLDNLAPLAERAIAEAMESVRAEWLFTRHDVVAHSQGGLLTRMLCSQNGNNHVPLPYRNEENFFRGRFHRVVTIGSPHNGTRLLRYLLTLNNNKQDALPSWVGYAMVESNTAQAKFDPWGDQIRELNDQGPASIWAPDPAAMFHLVGTHILGGANFTPGYSECPAMWALGIDSPEAGQIVAEEGSDGVVDYASMHARAPGGTTPANAYSVALQNRISHAFVEVANLNIGEIFGATSGQVLSPIVARHVMAVLNQDPNVPTADRQLASFQVPRLLDDSTRDAIDALARGFDVDPTVPGYILDSPIGGLGGRAARPAADVLTFKLKLVEPTDHPVTGKIFWVAQLYGTNGVTSKGLEILPNGADRDAVSVRVSADVYGDVVLEGIYKSTGGTRGVLKPYLIASIVPPGVTSTGFAVVPGDQALHSAGALAPIEIWTRWSDGRRFRRFVKPADLLVTTSASDIVNVANPLRWRAGAPGEATLTTTFEGKTNTVAWSVFDPAASGAVRVALKIEQVTPSGVVVSWPSDSGAVLQLQATERLRAGADWKNSVTAPIQDGNRFVLEVPSGSTARFYRLQKLP